MSSTADTARVDQDQRDEASWDPLHTDVGVATLNVGLPMAGVVRSRLTPRGA